jgi:hypothetical protein
MKSENNRSIPKDVAASGGRPLGRRTKKPHPGTDPRQADDRDGNEGHHRMMPPEPDNPFREAAERRKATPRKTTRSKVTPRAVSDSGKSPHGKRSQRS